MKRFTIIPLVIAILWVACKTTQPTPGETFSYPIAKQAFSDKAMVVSAHPVASQVGLEIIKQGGNAVDAAIAVQFALAVVYPNAGNIGGGGFMVLRNYDGTIDAIDFREKAPAAAHRDMYLDKEKNVIQGLSLSGHLAAGVPGSVDGMIKAFEKYSKLKDWKALLNPAIQIANKGFRLTKNQARGLNNSKARFEKIQYSNTGFCQ